MKNMKLWARIGAILACVLLVGVLAIPCFADDTQTTVDAVEPPEPPPDGYTPPYGSAIDAFTSTLDSRADNLTYGLLLSYYNGFGDSRFFDIKTLVSGTMDLLNNGDYSITLPIDMYVPVGTTFNYNERMNVDSLAIAVYYGSNSVPQNQTYYGNGYINYTLRVDEDSCGLDIDFITNNSVVPRVSFRYQGTYDDVATLELTSFGFDGVNYTLTDIYSIDLSFAVGNYDDAMVLPDVVATLYSAATYFYADKVYSPYEFYQGFKKSYNLGYADAERWAYQYGYEAGHTDGYNEGYENGVEDGKASQPTYQEGYNAALNDVDSGDFGRNFLSGVFTAPLRAMENFKIVQWETQSGDIYSVSLLTILSAIVGLSLFIWFLKMFAGG